MASIHYNLSILFVQELPNIFYLQYLYDYKYVEDYLYNEIYCNFHKLYLHSFYKNMFLYLNLDFEFAHILSILVYQIIIYY